MPPASPALSEILSSCLLPGPCAFPVWLEILCHLVLPLTRWYCLPGYRIVISYLLSWLWFKCVLFAACALRCLGKKKNKQGHLCKGYWTERATSLCNLSEGCSWECMHCLWQLWEMDSYHWDVHRTTKVAAWCTCWTWWFWHKLPLYIVSYQ